MAAKSGELTVREAREIAQVLDDWAISLSFQHGSTTDDSVLFVAS